MSLVALLLVHLLLQSSISCSASASVSKIETLLIQETCKHTDYYNLCVASLESDPRSLNADVKELAIILVELLQANANETLWHVGDLFKKVSDPALYRFYGTRIEEYRAIVERQIPEAIDALQSGDYMVSKKDAEAAAAHADSCEEQFAGETQPFSDQNKAVHGLSLVTSSILGILG
ncbi:PMEI domain-containing protein [Citrus sinensis]|uniref:cell wall / vacuolar inhibitor of fructosidase 1 n=1 Tax=Citrus sinensis TaxID=2711 RepID=UPI0003D707A1|nr:cell wall / vacuolar inhibitor of fructosidase 1 [Citrus sinensis]KAH9766255.1 PMEI domain-containing protein [Citrus sinensis]GAY35658.1 hypothetical protein CUMW_017620 [Citrus unshiu]